MIELFACAPLSAAITRRQCAINRETHVSCLRCTGLGALVEAISGELAVEPRPRLKPDYSWRGGQRRNVPLTDPLQEESGHEVGIEVMATPSRTISFDVVDIDDLALLGRVEKIAYENGSTLGDEILLWLRVMESEL